MAGTRTNHGVATTGGCSGVFESALSTPRLNHHCARFDPHGSGFTYGSSGLWGSGCWNSGVCERSFNLVSIDGCRGESGAIIGDDIYILIGAQFFGVVFRGLHGESTLAWVAAQFVDQKTWLLLAILVAVFVLGCFLDFLEICFIVVPIVTPILVKLGVDRLWFAIVLGLNLQTSFLTPPFGFTLFYLKGVAPPHMSTGNLYRGVVPFIVIQILVMIAVFLLPEIATFLPRLAL
jgi:TRAP-type mannitol/chloroaromatic compound transport system permease large subunit